MPVGGWRPVRMPSPYSQDLRDRVMGGPRPHRLAGKRDWLLARIAEKPDQMLRALRAELAADGVKVSHGALWGFFAREGITFKKRACTPANRACPGVGRGPRRHCSPARAVEEISGPAR